MTWNKYEKISVRTLSSVCMKVSTECSEDSTLDASKKSLYASFISIRGSLGYRTSSGGSVALSLEPAFRVRQMKPLDNPSSYNAPIDL